MQKLQSRHAVTEEQKQTYAGMYVLKKMDLKPKEGGMVFEVILPHELSPLDDVFQRLLYQNYVRVNRKNRYEITEQGYAYIRALIDEAEAYVDEFDDEEVEDMVEELRARNIDVFRVRFLWGWYQNEFDDLSLFQERRGMSPVETLWAIFLLDDGFYDNLALDIAG